MQSQLVWQPTSMNVCRLARNTYTHKPSTVTIVHAPRVNKNASRALEEFWSRAAVFQLKKYKLKKGKEAVKVWT